MPRRKMPAIKDPSRIAEILHRKGKDPYEEMLRVVEETIPIPHDVDPKIVAPMMDRYDIGEKDGKRCLKLKAMHRFEIWKELSQYVYPKLRSSETKEEKDFKLTVVVNTFDKQEPVKRIGIEIPQLEDAMRKAIDLPKE